MYTERVQEVETPGIARNFLKRYESDCTRKNYESDLKRFFGVKSVDEISEWAIRTVKVKDCVEYIGKLRNKGVCDSTIKRNISTLRSFLDYCVDVEEILKKNVCCEKVVGKTIELCEKKYEVKGRAMDRVEIEKLLGVIENVKHRTMFKLMLWTGVRISEILKIKKEDIECDDGKWYLKIEGKGRKVRTLQIREDLAKELMCFANEGVIFRYSDDAVNKMLKKYAKKAGVEVVKCHDLRRTVITGLIKNGMSLDKVRRYVGHASLRTTERYFRDYEDMRKNEACEYINWV